MRTVLIAPIGDHPVVVTAAVDKLAEVGITITDIDLIHTTHPLIKQGAEWVELFLDNCEVRCYSLTSGDVNSQEAAKEYLQTLTAILLSCEQVGDEVHMLLSGGRKNMSALTAVVAGFFSCIKGLYHILDKHEEDPQKRNFFTVEELNNYPDDIKHQKMHPPLETINLFNVPFPHFNKIEAKEIRDCLLNPSGIIPDVLIDANSEALLFYRAIFQRHEVKPLEFWFTNQGKEHFTSIARKNPTLAREYLQYFKGMIDPIRLRIKDVGWHFNYNELGHRFYFHHPNATRARPFFYTLPKAIEFFLEENPNKNPVTRVIVHGLSDHYAEGGSNLPDKEAAKRTKDRFLRDGDIAPHCTLDHTVQEIESELNRKIVQRQAILLVPLGDTLMVASQAYMLLKQFIEVTRMVLLYPGENGRIRNAADDLVSDFQKEKLDCLCQSVPVAGLADVDSTDACNAYVKTVAETINALRTAYPNHEIHLLLSGGRKSMTALNFFAAQYAQLPRVWHTLVKSSVLEEQIRQELKRNDSNSRARRDILFLRKYTPEKFDIFEVPVIPLRDREQTA